MIWHTQEFQDLMSSDEIYVVDLDMCSYCLRPPDHKQLGPDVRVKKPTRLVTNVKELCAMERKCDGNRTHQEALGDCIDETGKRVKRSKAAGAYPPAFCRSYAQAVKSSFNHART